ncbi:MAG: TROVE domain-containing protein [Acidimicrobiales bacterium]|nr:TROVE domain-containing protein [Acidimicrobiales bacterium]
MAKFSKTNRVAPSAPVKTSGATLTHERGRGAAPDLESELFLMAATYLAGEDTFYESADEREARFVELVRRVVATNPTFVARLAPYLRNKLKIRSASIVLAAEYVAAGGERGRPVIDAALQRGDEPAEMIGYWHSRHGRRLPMAVKRGVADAAVRLYNERSALRYDGLGRGVRMADVIELTHPKARDAQQSALFTWLLDRRHHDDAVADPEVLPMLAAAEDLAAVPNDERRDLLDERGPTALAEAGTSWERLSGWLPGGMDAAAWEAVIPSMGVMALIRNLRNFDEKGISPAAVETVLGRITDADEVAKARLFPYQVWAAYKHAPSDNWKRALGQTLELTARNIPALDRTLVVIDMSGSMQARVSNRSVMSRVEVAAVMAAVTVKRSANADIAIFGHTNQRVKLRKGASVLGSVERLVSMIGVVGHATYGHTAIAAHFTPRKHDRVVLFTDDQMHDAGSVNLSDVPLIYTVDLAGYRPRSLPSGGRGRYTLAGFSDAMFSLVHTLEAGLDADWPF